MVHGTYLLVILIATIFGWASWIVVINKLSPFTTPQLALSLFYTSLFVALAGTLALMIYYIRAWLNKGEVSNIHVNIALRQGVLLSTMICIGIAFQRLKVLTWWDGLLLLAIVLLIEFYFMARD
jgi:Na+/melibiose symporter-like transporter